MYTIGLYLFLMIITLLLPSLLPVHWNGNVALTNISSLPAMSFVFISQVSPRGGTEENFVRLKIFKFQCVINFPGSSWQQTLYTAIDSSDVVISLISADYVLSAVCNEEYNLALAKHLSPVMHNACGVAWNCFLSKMGNTCIARSSKTRAIN